MTSKASSEEDKPQVANPSMALLHVKTPSGQHTRMQDQEKVDFGISSPSPRGIETWGPCSPFHLPEPTGDVNFLEPADISRLLQVSDVSNTRTHEIETEEGVGSDLMDIDLVTKMSDLYSPFLRNSPFERKAMTSESGLQETTRPEWKNDGLTRSFPVFSNDPFPSPGHGPQMENDILEKSYCGVEIEQGTEQNNGRGGVEAIDADDGHIAFTIATGGKENETQYSGISHITDPRNTSTCTSRGDSELTEMLKKPGAFQESTKRDCGQSSCGESKQIDCVGIEEREKDKTAGETAEEQLKRIRRVKNRASVEKCRAKQRQRMEDLKAEMHALKSENKTLLALTTWMESTIDVISTGVHEFTHSHNFDANSEIEGSESGGDS